MADDLGERSEEATPKKRQEAREEGKVAKSSDLSAAMVLGAGTLILAATVGWMLTAGGRMVAMFLAGEFPDDAMDAGNAPAALAGAFSQGAILAAPLAGLLWIAAASASLVQVGWLVAPKALAPQLGRINPLKGFQRIFGVNAAVKASLDSLKVLVVGSVAFAAIAVRRADIVGLAALDPGPAALAIGGMLLTIALQVLAILLLLAILDLIFQKWKYQKDLRMTKQQVKDEFKQLDGDPEVRRRRMRMQQQLSMQRIGAAVPKADVIVTNPEHLSIAVRWDESTMRAPQVIAKGADHLALRIRQIAMRHGIPIVERKPLARALYRDVEVGREIPPALYQAVAEVLAFVHRIARRAG